MATEDDRPRLKLNAHMITDVGVVRDHNEDAAFIDEESEFFVVADGMGGHAAGEVASGMAVEKVREGLEAARDVVHKFATEPTDAGRKELVALLEQSVRAAHQAVYDRGAKETDKQGMGTTLDVVLLAGPEAFVAHVGDSRTYLVRDGKAAQITTDHTVAEVLVIEGKLSLEEAQISPLRTILVNAIGVAPDVGVEMAHVRLRTDDRLLLCSDGLHDYFPVEGELAEKMVDKEPKGALDEMVSLAKSRGGHDNITGILLEVIEAPPEEEGEEVPKDPFSDTTSVQGSGGSDAVPHEISRDDTQPVDRGLKKRLSGDADADTEETSESGSVEADAATPPAEQKKAEKNDGDGDDSDSDDDDGESDDGDGDGDGDEGDLKSTVRMKPLSQKELNAAGDDDKDARDGKNKKRKRKKRRWRKKKKDGGDSSDDSSEGGELKAAGSSEGSQDADDSDAVREAGPGGSAADPSR